jgi:hypothetical protein
MYFGKQIVKFRRRLLPPFTETKIQAACFSETCTCIHHRTCYNIPEHRDPHTPTCKLHNMYAYIDCSYPNLYCAFFSNNNLCFYLYWPHYLSSMFLTHYKQYFTLFNLYTVHFSSLYTIIQQMHCYDQCYSDVTVGTLKVLLTTTTGCIESLTHIIKPYAH